MLIQYMLHRPPGNDASHRNQFHLMAMMSYVMLQTRSGHLDDWMMFMKMA